MNLGFLETLWQDARYAVRGLRRNTGFTLVALLSLALGIGATTAIFSVVYGVLDLAVSLREAGRNLGARDSRPQGSPAVARLPSHARLRGDQEAAGVRRSYGDPPGNRLLTGESRAGKLPGHCRHRQRVPFSRRAGMWAARSNPSDIKPDGQSEPVIVLSYKAWQRLFDGSPAALGTDADAQRPAVHRDRRDAAALRLVSRTKVDGSRCRRSRATTRRGRRSSA